MITVPQRAAIATYVAAETRYRATAPHSDYFAESLAALKAATQTSRTLGVLGPSIAACASARNAP